MKKHQIQYYCLALLAIVLFACNTTKPTEMLYTVSPETKLTELGIELVKAGPPVANYVNTVRTGNLVYT